ncbi:cupin domain protein [Burkholderia thailandensis E444]|nr:cupin domain protein [Burkholderia thailandensis E444]
MFEIRRAGDRGHANHGWLDTCHSFSFADYRDPEHVHFGALRVLNDDRIAPTRGFGMHPHRDMEIVTYVLEGALAHRDSMGNGSIVRAGDVQRMSAGTGIVHSEYNASRDAPLHLLQIWLLPTEPGGRPGYSGGALRRRRQTRPAAARRVARRARRGGVGALGRVDLCGARRRRRARRVRAAGRPARVRACRARQRGGERRGARGGRRRADRRRRDRRVRARRACGGVAVRSRVTRRARSRPHAARMRVGPAGAREEEGAARTRRAGPHRCDNAATGREPDAAPVRLDGERRSRRFGGRREGAPPGVTAAAQAPTRPSPRAAAPSAPSSSRDALPSSRIAA